MKRLFIYVFLFFTLIAACAPFSQKVLKEAQPALSLSDVRNDPDRSKGKMVIWGGVIIETLNRMDETILKVMQTGLDYQKRPEKTDKSLGRFMIRYKGFLDPYIYGKGREITVAGVISGKEEQAIGDIHYVYPVVDSQELRLWEKQEVIYHDPWFWGPPYGWGYPHPWRRYPYGR
jgi:outer membrane lipoprotein